MTMEQNTWLIIFGSAGCGAFVSSLVSALTQFFIKQMESKQHDMEIALKLVELKEKQLRTVQEWAIKEAPLPASFADPAFNLLEYLKAIDEIRSKRTWKKMSAAPN